MFHFGGFNEDFMYTFLAIILLSFPAYFGAECSVFELHHTFLWKRCVGDFSESPAFTAKAQSVLHLLGWVSVALHFVFFAKTVEHEKRLKHSIYLVQHNFNTFNSGITQGSGFLAQQLL